MFLTLADSQPWAGLSLLPIPLLQKKKNLKKITQPEEFSNFTPKLAHPEQVLGFFFALQQHRGWRGSKNLGGTQDQEVMLQLHIPSRSKMLTGCAWSILSLFARFDFGASLPTHILHHTQPRSKNPPVFIKWHENAPVCAALNLEARQRLQLTQFFEFFLQSPSSFPPLRLSSLLSNFCLKFATSFEQNPLNFFCRQKWFIL